MLVQVINMKRYLGTALIVIILGIAAWISFDVSAELMQYFFKPMYALAPAPLPPPVSPMMGIEAGPIKVNISEDTPWQGIAKLLVTVLGAYLGIKLVNKFCK